MDDKDAKRKEIVAMVDEKGRPGLITDVCFGKEDNKVAVIKTLTGKEVYSVSVKDWLKKHNCSSVTSDQILQEYQDKFYPEDTEDPDKYRC